jgi:hypothetical protein
LKNEAADQASGLSSRLQRPEWTRRAGMGITGDYVAAFQNNFDGQRQLDDSDHLQNETPSRRRGR